MSVSFSNNKKEFAGWILIGFIIIIIIITIYLGYFFRGEEKIKLAFKNGYTLSFFVAGINNENMIKGSALIFFQTKTCRTTVVSILPKTYIYINEKSGYMTLEEVLKKKIKYEDITASISKLIGKEINYYCFINKENFEKLIDVFGGVDIETEEYKYPNLKVNIPAGRKILDGDKSIEYLSFINDDEPNYEYKQLKREQDLIKSFFVLKHDFLEQYNDYVISNYIYKRLITNISLNELIIIFDEIKDKYKDGIRDFSKSIDPIILYCDWNKINDKVYVYMPKKSGEWIKSLVDQSLKNLEKENSMNDNLLIEILNGTDVVGLGSKAKNYLASYGFEVDNVTNADKSDYNKTTVVIYSNEQKARKMAELINCRNVVIGENLENKKVNATLIIGFDFDGRVVR